jgi:hypothetical protein
MQTGLHALSWTMQRLGIAVGIGVVLIVFAYVMVITVIVVGQAAVAFGQ